MHNDIYEYWVAIDFVILFRFWCLTSVSFQIFFLDVTSFNFLIEMLLNKYELFSVLCSNFYFSWQVVIAALIANWCSILYFRLQKINATFFPRLHERFNVVVSINITDQNVFHILQCLNLGWCLNSVIFYHWFSLCSFVVIHI